jgi:glutathione-specific gamma-glutamylcyclotransferase
MRQPTRKVAYQHLEGVVMEASISTKRLAIFAYGSLLFRPGFSFLERQRARAPGYARSFSQASPDHRGTPERPGRVLTLAASAAASTTGAVYFVEAPALELLLELDHRERAGYQRINLEVWTDAERHQALTWIALPGNPYDAGQLPLAELAQHIRSCHGPSGANSDYVFQLERALAELEAPDALVSELAARLRG